MKEVNNILKESKVYLCLQHTFIRFCRVWIQRNPAKNYRYIEIVRTLVFAKVINSDTDIMRARKFKFSLVSRK